MNEEKINIIEYLDEELLTFINQKEEERKKNLQFVKIFSLILIFIFLIILINSKFNDLLFFLVIITIILVICYYLFLNVLFEDLKNEIFNHFINKLKNTFSYYPHKSLSKEDFLNCELFEKPDYFSASKLFEGKIDKTYIKFGYVSAQVITKEFDSNNDFEDDFYYDDFDESRVSHQIRTTHSDNIVTIFNGFLYCADFNKKISGTTKLYPKGFINLFEGLLFENPEFMSSFFVKKHR